MEGYIKLYRKLLENPIICRDSDHLAVWIYLLLNATHKEIPALFRGGKITLLPGQLLTGRLSISSDLSISESKVKRILISFESDHQIDRDRSNKNSLITIVNWNTYQSIDQQDDQQMTSNRPASDHKQECKNVISIYTTSELPDGSPDKQTLKKIFDHDSNPYKGALYLDHEICRRLETKQPSNEATLQKWALTFDRLNRLDKQPWKLIGQVLEFSQADPFWCNNILSADTFRKQFFKLQSKMEGQR